jgi:hypothetical protein
MALSGAQHALSLTGNDLLATCLYAYLSHEGGYTMVYGDGVIALKFRDGTVVMHRLDWADNTPYYPAYAANRLGDFIRTHGNDPSAHRLTHTTALLDASGVLSVGEPVTYSVAEGVKGIKLEIDPEMLGSLHFVALFSDGVTQVENTDWTSVVADGVRYRGLAGEFAKRRMISLVKDSRGRGRGPLDDLSCAVIQVTHNTEGEG